MSERGSRHLGHLSLWQMARRRHARQKVCPQGVEQGRTHRSRHMLQVSSSLSASMRSSLDGVAPSLDFWASPAGTFGHCKALKFQKTFLRIFDP